MKCYIYGNVRLPHSSIIIVCDNTGRIKERAWYEKEEMGSKNTSLSEWTIPKMYDLGLLNIFES